MRFLFVFLFSVAALAQDRVVLQTNVILDGKGGVLKNQQIVIEGWADCLGGTGES